jgi:hypothetical protein
MLKSLRKVVFAALVVALASTSALACTVVAVGKNATVDGTRIITHNDDSGWRIRVSTSCRRPTGPKDRSGTS